ncbi:MAG TPA: hypothetical protein VFP94_03745 [Terriglobales bacterium]|nr:hypothetical protein [Terriglobales bacterium]
MRKNWLQGLMILLMVLPTLGTLGAVACLPAASACQPRVMCRMAQRSSGAPAACCRCQLRPSQTLPMVSLPQALPPALAAVNGPTLVPSLTPMEPAESGHTGFAALPYRPPRPLPALA